MSEYYQKGFEWAKNHPGPSVNLPFYWVEWDEPDPDGNNEKNTDFYNGAIDYWRQKEIADYKLDAFLKELQAVAKKYNATICVSDVTVNNQQIHHYKFDGENVYNG